MSAISTPPSRGGSRERAASTRHGPGSLKGLQRLLRLEAAQLGRPSVESPLETDDALLSKERGPGVSTGSPGKGVIRRSRSPCSWDQRWDRRSESLLRSALWTFKRSR